MKNGRTTIADIAGKLNVSLNTVNKALYGKPGVGPELRGRILETARAMNYRVNRIAQSMSRKPLRLAVVSESGQFGQRPEFLNGIQNALEQLADYNAGGEFITVDGAIDGALLEKPEVSAFIFNHITLDDEQERFLCSRNVPFAYLGNDRFDSESRRAICIRSDARQVGACAADLFALMLQPGDEVGVLTGFRSYRDHAEKVEAFVDTAGQYGLHPVGVAEHGDRPEEVEACYRSLRKAHPALRGVFLATGVSGTLFEALAAEGSSRCRCVAVDRYPGSAAALARGSIDAIVHQNAQLAGRRMIEEFYRILTGEKLSGELLLIEPEILLRHTGRPEE